MTIINKNIPDITTIEIEQCNFTAIGEICFYYWNKYSKALPTQSTVAIWRIKPKKK